MPWTIYSSPSFLNCFGDQKAIKTPKLNTILLELIARVLNMLIGLKGNNYYSKVFKRVNYKLWNSNFWVVINRVVCLDQKLRSFLFFSIVHFISFISHVFVIHSLHSWSLPKRGIFVDPHFLSIGRGYFGPHIYHF